MHLHSHLEDLVRSALIEDIDRGDLTTEACVPEEARCHARLVAKEDGVLSGIKPFHMAFMLLDADITAWQALDDGSPIRVGDVVAEFQGHTRAVLTAERTAMNFTQHLSGVATMTRQFVRALDGLSCKICDTRKTNPMMRYLEKQAVIDGGGLAHRYNLFNGVLIKENHITAAGGITAAIQKARAHAHHLMRIECEVRNLVEFDEALAAGAGAIMLDNMSYDDMREAVRRAQGRDVVLEGSGNASAETIRAMAETGVHIISVGRITHSAPVVDMSLLIEKCD